MGKMDENEIARRLIPNKALFADIYLVSKKFDIIPDNHMHYGASIDYQDMQELREDFLNDLYDSIIDWIYSAEKYASLKEQETKKGKTEASAHASVQRKAINKLRKGNQDNLLIQGQFGELILFHFIQKCMGAVPLLRKMKITTSSQHERFGADAIHYKVEGDKNIIILGEAKTYSSKYRFNNAFNDSLTSILNTYKSHRDELNLYVHEDFLDEQMNEVAEAYLDKNLPNTEIHLVNVIIYNETEKVVQTNEDDIRGQIENIIEKRYRDFDNGKIPIDVNPILNRMTYIIFPIWKLDDLIKEFQERL
ncbi:MAG: DUF1837 domain-containing protein [Lachnospiraceae bacterium]|nr:DUF1837 domain-containing protein [Lachnospiraceae bacterium]